MTKGQRLSFLDQIPGNIVDLTRKRLLDGDFNLLLGAGASRDSLGRNGNTLPNSDELRQELNSRFRVKQPSLPDAYEVSLGKSPDSVMRFLEERLTGTRPSAWWDDMTKATWRRIWSLNIDDVVERAYERASECTQPLRNVFTWSDQVNDLPGLSLVHLHGLFRKGIPPELIFSITEYASAIEARHGWHRRFFDAWVSQPFITVGARLLNEYDLAQATRAKKTSGLEPSLYVSSTIDDATREQLAQRNMLGIQMKAADFAAEVADLMADRRKQSRFQWQSTPLDAAKLATFSSQFEHLSAESRFNPTGHDFYLGDEPSWTDVVSGKPALFEVHEKIADRVVHSLKSPSPMTLLHLVRGHRLQGRTVALLQAAAKISAKGYPVFRFREGQRVDLDAATDFVMARPDTVLLFDGVADYADDIAALLGRVRDLGGRCVALGTEAQTRMRLVFARLDPSFLAPQDRDLVPVGVLNRTDSEALVRKLESAGRLNVLLQVPRGDRINHFIGRDIFDAMSEIEYGRGYQRRFSDQLARITDPSHRRLVVLAALLTGYFHVSLPIAFIGATGVQAGDFSSAATRSSLDPYLNIEDGLVRSRFRTLNVAHIQRVVDSVGLPDLLTEFLITMSPYMDANSRRDRTSAYLLVKAVMRARPLSKVIGLENLRRLYDRLEPSYSENARYWEQRAIAEELLGNMAIATSYSATAASKAPSDPWRATTHGRMLSVRARRDPSLSPDEASDLMRRAVREFTRAYDLDSDNPLPLQLEHMSLIDYYRRNIRAGVAVGTFEWAQRTVQDSNRALKDHPRLGLQDRQTVESEFAYFLKLYTGRDALLGRPESLTASENHELDLEDVTD